MPPWHTESCVDDQGRKLDPLSMFLGNLPKATSEGEIRAWLAERDCLAGLNRVKMINSLPHVAAAICNYVTPRNAKEAIKAFEGDGARQACGH